MSENNNEKITVEDIKKINDSKELENIALTNPNCEVCIKAAQKIKNQNALKKIALKSPKGKVRLAAVRRINDSNFLIDIARNDCDKEVIKEALKNPHLKNQSILMEFVKKNKDYRRLAALSNPNFDKDLLFKLARRDSYRNYTYEAIYNNFVEKYAKEKYAEYEIYSMNNNEIYNYYIIDLATSKIEKDYLIQDERTLSLIEENRPYEEIFNSKTYDELLNLAKIRNFYADYYLIHIKDESILIDYMQSERYNWLQSEIPKYISDESIIIDNSTNYDTIHNDSSLEYLALRNKYSLEKMISKITDQDILMNIALTHNLEDARAFAVLGMDNEYASDYISIKNYDYTKEKILRENDFMEILDEISKIRLLDIQLALIKCIPDEEILEQIALSNYRVGFKRACVRTIKDNFKLLKIINEESSSYVRLDAVCNITDEKMTVSIAKDCPDLDIRIEATKRITNEDILAKIAECDESKTIRKYAIRNPNLCSKSKLRDILQRETEDKNRMEILEKLCFLGDD